MLFLPNDDALDAQAKAISDYFLSAEVSFHAVFVTDYIYPFFFRICFSCSVGMLFLPNDDALEAQAKAIIDEVVSAEGLKVLGYRQVPVDHAVVGRFAKDTQPRIWQVRTLVCKIPWGWWRIVDGEWDCTKDRDGLRAGVAGDAEDIADLAAGKIREQL